MGTCACVHVRERKAVKELGDEEDNLALAVEVVIDVSVSSHCFLRLSSLFLLF